MRNVLLTGFEPFAGERLNPSALIAEALDGREIAGRRVRGAVLPCAFGDSRRAMLRLMRAVEPDLILCTGQAGGRPNLTPERVAINLDDARIPDNRGAQPRDRPIVRGGPVAYWSTLPIKAMVAALQARGIPAAVSHTAGTYVCNHVFYGLMHELARRSLGVAGRRLRSRGADLGPGAARARTQGRKRAAALEAMRGGFIHVPWLPEQGAAHAGEPSLPLATMIEGIELAMVTALATRRDLSAPGGAEH
jgi:pyroglutamyl-peptidase